MEDMSNKVVFVLVILTVVISIFGTVMLIDGAGLIGSSDVPNTGANSGKIAYNLVNQEKVTDPVNGEIRFGIENPSI
jgi:hypothetical protein